MQVWNPAETAAAVAAAEENGQIPTMAVAYVQFHWKLAMNDHFFPAVNHGELALLYAVLFLYVACRGAGKMAIDKP